MDSSKLGIAVSVFRLISQPLAQLSVSFPSYVSDIQFSPATQIPGRRRSTVFAGLPTRAQSTVTTAVLSAMGPSLTSPQRHIWTFTLAAPPPPPIHIFVNKDCAPTSTPWPLEGRTQTPRAPFRGLFRTDLCLQPWRGRIGRSSMSSWTRKFPRSTTEWGSEQVSSLVTSDPPRAYTQRLRLSCWPNTFGHPGKCHSRRHHHSLELPYGCLRAHSLREKHSPSDSSADTKSLGKASIA
ncbi:hypothetical protein AG1IA_09473 [Rhizoctonia solani AG-1 IA]|uniref:Uncharacterized protein n=1 Tax=Thanatephorus cucumeris (strain AG1-IA) TaxID=983506 RepID=L8WE83_THACA|nr:hypothetical protein AG1IA_09473 [Rhizoctonia solani AG-1 IA]